MLGHQNLVRGIDSSGVGGAVPDLEHTVDAGQEHNEYGPGHGLDHDWTPPSLNLVQRHDHQLPQRGLEQKQHNQRHFAEDHRVQELYHLLRLTPDPYLSELER